MMQVTTNHVLLFVCPIVSRSSGVTTPPGILVTIARVVASRRGIPSYVSVMAGLRYEGLYRRGLSLLCRAGPKKQRTCKPGVSFSHKNRAKKGRCRIFPLRPIIREGLFTVRPIARDRDTTERSGPDPAAGRAPRRHHKTP